MTINLFYLERRGVLIGSVQFFLERQKKKKELNVLASKTYEVQDLQDCNCD